MRTVATKNRKRKKKYPWRIILDNGRQIPVPSQHDFKSDFIQHHGCSLVAFYMALRYKGIKKNMQQCLAYVKKKLKCGAKYPLTEIARGINMICSGKPATYHKSLTTEQLNVKLKPDSYRGIACGLKNGKDLEVFGRKEKCSNC